MAFAAAATVTALRQALPGPFGQVAKVCIANIASLPSEFGFIHLHMTKTCD